ncbi:hypothetical protein [Bartonella sp. AP58NXGY]|uniref:hypothetical protein n=1 Tax=Bartonella sp. AP58NXGY TaxID=3243498 RepID=UPI0035CFB2AC
MLEEGAKQGGAKSAGSTKSLAMNVKAYWDNGGVKAGSLERMQGGAVLLEGKTRMGVGPSV